MAEHLRIDRLGHRGDGIADLPGGPVYVPFTLPGETVSVAREAERGRLIELLEPSPARVDSICPHFGECGGCSVQHLNPRSYLAWKQELVRTALAQRGLDMAVDEPVRVPLRSRRRAVFAARRTKRGILLGYHARQSHRIVPVSTCPVVVPGIERALPALAGWLAPVIPLKGEVRIAVTETMGGLDIALEGPAARPPAVLAELAATQPRGIALARLSIAGEPILMPGEPAI